MEDPEHLSATRAAYDATADSYVQAIGTVISAAVEAPLDRALLEAFVEHVTQAPEGRVADVGCGPGRVAALLADCGLEVMGVDVSPAMLAIARNAHPGIPFEEGSLTTLPLPSASLIGVVCWYSIIHTPPEQLDDAFTELARVLHPEGHLLLAFQAGAGEAVHRSEVYGTEASLTSYRHAPNQVTQSAIRAGLQPHAQATRGPELPHESTQQAFILARHRA